MIYDLSGVETSNKGAELMLYAILQEIEHKDSNAIVYVSPFAIPQGVDYIHTNVTLKFRPKSKLIKWYKKFHINYLAYVLHLEKYITDIYTPVEKADYFFDASGFQFSDQWKLDKHTAQRWKKQLKGYHKQGTKIVFLPQAFGPLQLTNTRKTMEVISEYADLIMPRENVSLSYLKDFGTPSEKVQMYTDFTSLVEGQMPSQYNFLAGGICIIPNRQMFAKNVISMEEYCSFIKKVIELLGTHNRPIYLLNHASQGDENVALRCQQLLNNKVHVVTGLNALEVKGLIASAYFCISSRFHGVASALNSSVPCLATSWSHKYQELFNDYGIKDSILPINDLNKSLLIIEQYASASNLSNVRKQLARKKNEIQQQSKEMWDYIWSL